MGGIFYSETVDSISIGAGSGAGSCAGSGSSACVCTTRFFASSSSFCFQLIAAIDNLAGGWVGVGVGVGSIGAGVASVVVVSAIGGCSRVGSG